MKVYCLEVWKILQSFFFNFISDHKTGLLINDLPFLEEAGYVDIEDVLKKGNDELKKLMEEKDILKPTITLINDFLAQNLNFK